MLERFQQKNLILIITSSPLFLNRQVNKTRMPVVSALNILYTSSININTSLIQPDLLHPTKKSQKRKYKTKRLVQAPNSFFMDVKCPGCFQMLSKITKIFIHMIHNDRFSFHFILESFHIKKHCLLFK